MQISSKMTKERTMNSLCFGIKKSDGVTSVNQPYLINPLKPESQEIINKAY